MDSECRAYEIVVSSAVMAHRSAFNRRAEQSRDFARRDALAEKSREVRETEKQSSVEAPEAVCSLV